MDALFKLNINKSSCSGGTTCVLSLPWVFFDVFLLHVIYPFDFWYPDGKLPPDEPATLPPLPLITKNDKRKFSTGTPQSLKRFDHRDWERDRDRERDVELMPPPGSQKRDFATPLEVDHPIDPDEPTYCVCHQVLSFQIFLF